MSDYWTNQGAKYKLLVHLVWCPKYRRPVLTETVQERLKEILEEVCEEHDWEIQSLETRSDHVHVLVQYHSKHSTAYVANQFKGKSSHHLRKEFSHLRTRLPTLWSRSYFASSVGLNEQQIKNYIDTQNDKPTRARKKASK